MTPVNTLEVRSPLDGRVTGAVAIHDAAHVERTIARLRGEQTAWERAGVAERVRWLYRYRDWLLDNADGLSALLHEVTGKPVGEAPTEVFLTVDVINYYGRNARKFLADETPPPHSILLAAKRLRTRYRPYPVVGILSPWNYPLALTLFDAVAALLAGASVVVKPAPITSHIVRACVDGWAEIGAPPVFDCVTGEAATGSAVIDAVDYVQFTGSTATGTLVAQRAAARLVPCSLELGGKDPAIVLADADLKKAAAGITFGGLSNSGQMCTSVERVYVEEPVYDAFVDELVSAVSTVRQGVTNGFDVDLTSLISRTQLEIAQRHVDDAVAKGARILIGGKATGAGFGFQPTVLVDVDHTMDVMTEETFGPLLPVMKVRDAEAAIRLANASDYGLSASIWSRDVRRATAIGEQLEVGSVDVNDVSAHLACFPLPQSGWKKSGLGARLGGAYGLRKYCRTQAVLTDRIATPLVPLLLWFPYSAAKAKVLDTTFRLIDGKDLRRKLGL
ncbi:aldehyde dehydrogenase family protein [Nocardia tengchongensis]|uniref:aldehyde dehydrogenase family protein n=1 Tax=Nocardia tengchongensis TaxID=2055889 RepID=UPI00369DB565